MHGGSLLCLHIIIDTGLNTLLNAGVSSHDVNEDSAPLMILEYMPYGDMREFLRKNRSGSLLHIIAAVTFVLCKLPV